MGVALRRHRGAHNLFGTRQCRRLAKLVPNIAADNGTAALLNHAFIEWLVAPILFPDDAVLARPLGTGVFGAPVPVLRAVPVVWNTTRSTALVTHDAGGRYDILFPALRGNSPHRSEAPSFGGDRAILVPRTRWLHYPLTKHGRGSKRHGG